MRTSEVEVNSRFAMMVNDKEHRAFKTRCASEGVEMSVVLREFIREYTKRKK